MTENRPRRILIAPLDWGLGHTTRCIPIIKHLLQAGHHVIAACNKWQRSFLQQTFPGIEFVQLDGYNITYSNKLSPAGAANLKLVPQVCRAIKSEHDWLQQHLATLKPDGIIADNRYGLYSNTIPCVIITHQLQVQTGMGAAANKLVQRMHYRFLEQFNEVWVPDVADAHNLAGQLSHTLKLPAKTTYIGLLSQFGGQQKKEANEGYLLVLLSGPEPQRSMLSALLWAQLKEHKGRVIFVAGSQAAQQPEPTLPANITYYKTLAGAQLADTLMAADIIICRSGYSTLMDLILLGKKAILIPTPGQTEQEYLANHLQEQGIFPYQNQKNFNLAVALNSAAKFPYTFPDLQSRYGDYEKVVERWVKQL